MTATVPSNLQPHRQPNVCPDRSATVRLRVIEGGRSPKRLAGRYRRRRLVAAAVVVVVAVASGVAGRAAVEALRPVVPGAHPAPAVRPGASSGGPVVVVRQGDTLWSIARRIAPGGDIRASVDLLAAVHGTGPLQVGERLPVSALEGG